MFKESALYRITADRDELELLARPENFSEPNGVTLSDDERALFVATDEGISAFDVSSLARHQLMAPPEVSLKGIDGLYFYKRSLIAIHPGRKLARRYFLDEAMKSVTHAETIEAQHPMFNVPTTGVIVNDMFYYVANAQFGSFNKDGALFPLERLYEPVILKVRLSEEPLFHKQFGRIRAVALGPDGYLYFATSNRDSDGQEAKLATALDDGLFRFRLTGFEK